MDLNTTIANNFGMNVKEIEHESLNRTYVGYSSKYQQKVFLKLYRKVNHTKFVVEREVNQQLNDRYIGEFQLDEKITDFIYGLVLKDINPQNIDFRGDDSQIVFELGLQLGRFHKTVMPFDGLPSIVDLTDVVTEGIQQVHIVETRMALEQLQRDFMKTYPHIMQKTSSHSVVLHGDVGVRNFKIVASDLSFIDFERAKKGVPYLDFVKLFYQDFKLDNGLMDSFKKGYETVASLAEIPEHLRWYCVFYTAIGIIKYTERVDDKLFQMLGETMLSDCRCFLNGQVHPAI